MNLYTATIRGFKYYFSGNLTPDAIQAIEQFCLKLRTVDKSVDANEIFNRLLNYINSNMGLSATSINVEHIFRINY